MISEKPYQNKMTRRISVCMFFATALKLFFQFATLSAQGDEEVVLSFNHPAIGQYYISAVYSDNSFYLPSMELFNLLYVHYEKGSTGQSLQGTWTGADITWEINANTLKASIGKEHFDLTTGDFRIGELELYLSPALFERMFGLRFTINMSALSMSLESDKILPVEEKKQHEQLRKDLELRRTGEKDFPLLYPRNRRIFSAGMADYNLNLNADNNGFSANYTITGGLEMLGGDVQGTAYGAIGKTAIPLTTGNLNWRYALNENPFLTSVTIGQIRTSSLLGQSIIGGAISNDPIEPRKVYNTYSIEGSTIPDSEVELYINNQLTSFTRADELGYYRFNFSLTYGTVRINLRIYTPTGEIITEERQMQIPFTFLPKGVISYNMQGGAIDDGINDLGLSRNALHGDVAWGLSNTMTVKAGADFLSYQLKPLYYGSLSYRLFDQYLLNLDLAPHAFYRATASVTYGSGRSFNLIYTRFGNDSIYNPHLARQEFDASVYVPFRALGLQSGFRLTGEQYMMDSTGQTNYNLDFNTRIGRFNIRTNYHDQLHTGKEKTYFANGLITGAVTYTFSRTPGLPVLVKGMFLRAQAQYDVHNKKMIIAGLQFSRTVMRRARLNVNIDYYLRTSSARVQAGFTLDLNSVRSYTLYTGSGKEYAFQQTLNGSVGLDAASAKLSASSRQQVGKAAVSVLMFIDSNQNRRYDKGEEKVQARALRLGESATLDLGRDSILRFTQLQSYWKYNAEVVQSLLPSPSLAPLMSEFSFVADPNRYKRIEIPLYRTGVIEGRITLRKDSSDSGLGGVRLQLKGVDRTYEETIRTFADGGFYAMNLLPGKYTLEIDPAQLTFLNAVSQPVRVEFEVKALAEGDYIENLNILLLTGKN
jgi:hypothetical protein